MNHETHAKGQELERKYRTMQRELQAWNGLVQPPFMIDASMHAATSEAGVPMDAWRVFRQACIDHVRNAMEANRAEWDSL